MKGAQDPFERFVSDASAERFNPLCIETTIRLVGSDGTPEKPLTGETVSRIIEQAYRRVFGVIHDAHLNNFASIPDWRISNLSIHALTAAIVDPFIDATLGGDARLFHVCCQALIQSQQPLPRELWWTPIVNDLIVKANPVLCRGDSPLKLVLAQINYACYHYCFRFISRRDLPYRHDDPVRPVQGYRRNLRRVAKGHFTMLLDDLEHLTPRTGH